MIVIWGTKLYGKVDEIEGLGHVATQFGHLFWIPLIPLNSYFVTSEERFNFEGTPLGLQMKSVFVAYARVFAILFFMCGMGAANTLFSAHEVVEPERVTGLKMMIVLGIFSIPAYICAHLPSVRFANYATARELSDRVGFNSRLQTYIEYCYDRISEEEAERRIAEIRDNPTAAEVDTELAEIYQRYASA